ncbi:hypothetical protein [Streptomyces sp. URMC 125]|uniref:hypothetical protein n=1 Tax=Streptomyces sp. URMC 125 TaxID=3423419 RepID=UPI003F1AFD8D
MAEGDFETVMNDVAMSVARSALEEGAAFYKTMVEIAGGIREDARKAGFSRTASEAIALRFLDALTPGRPHEGRWA